MSGATGGDWPPIANLVYGGVSELMTLDLNQGPSGPQQGLAGAMANAIAGVIMSNYNSGPGFQLSGALINSIGNLVAPSGPFFGPGSPLTVALLQSFALEVQAGPSGQAGGLIFALRQQILGTGDP